MKMEKFTRFTLRLEENQVKKLRILEEKYSMSRAEILRKIIDTELDKIDYLILEKQELKQGIKTLSNYNIYFCRIQLIQ